MSTDKSLETASIATQILKFLPLLPLLISGLATLLYFMGVVYEQFYYGAFGIDSRMMGSSFQDLVIIGIQAWFLAWVDDFEWTVATWAAAAVICIIPAFVAERGWLPALFRLSGKIAGTDNKAKHEKLEPVPKEFSILAILGSGAFVVVALISLLMLVLAFGMRGISDAATDAANSKKQSLFVDNWDDGAACDGAVVLNSSKGPVIGLRLLSCTSSTCLFAKKGGYEFYSLGDVQRLSVGAC